jgi:cystathionine beta-synthase
MQKHHFINAPGDFGSEARQTRAWKEATIRDLNLPAVVSATESSTCEEAVSKMKTGGFDQLPVVNARGALSGLVTLGNIHSYLSSGKITTKTPVSQVMFDFSRLPSTSKSPGLKALLSPTKPRTRPSSPAPDRKMMKRGKVYWEITMDTKLDTLNQFFDMYPVALVTERKQDGSELDVVGVVTKVDILSFLVQKMGETGEE